MLVDAAEIVYKVESPLSSPLSREQRHTRTTKPTAPLPPPAQPTSTMVPLHTHFGRQGLPSATSTTSATSSYINHPITPLICSATRLHGRPMQRKVSVMQLAAARDIRQQGSFFLVFHHAPPHIHAKFLDNADLSC